jgi:hypothetical protein
MSPLLALNCRDGERMSRQLSGVKRTRHETSRAAAFDPKRTSAHIAQLLATVQRSNQRLSILYFLSVKWLRTGWRLVQRWRVIIGVLSWAALLPNSHRSRGASNSAIPIFGRGGLVIADDGKNLCYNAFVQSR